MGFSLWNYVGRIGPIVLIPLLVVGLFAKEGSVWALVGNVAWGVLIVLGLTGAVLALRLLFLRFRFACPRCRQRSTQFGTNREHGAWLYCEDCELVFRGGGFLKMKLVCETVKQEPCSPPRDPRDDAETAGKP
jgi:hypothetical protein